MSLSRVQHELAELRATDRSAASGEQNPYLAGGDDYVAPGAADVLEGEDAPKQHEGEEEEDGGGGDVPCGDDDEGDDVDETSVKVKQQLSRIFTYLLSCTGGGSKELGKPEFDLLGQVRGGKYGKFQYERESSLSVNAKTTEFGWVA